MQSKISQPKKNSKIPLPSSRKSTRTKINKIEIEVENEVEEKSEMELELQNLEFVEAEKIVNKKESKNKKDSAVVKKTKKNVK